MDEGVLKSKLFWPVRDQRAACAAQQLGDRMVGLCDVGDGKNQARIGGFAGHPPRFSVKQCRQRCLVTVDDDPDPL